MNRPAFRNIVIMLIALFAVLVTVFLNKYSNQNAGSGIDLNVENKEIPEISSEAGKIPGMDLEKATCDVHSRHQQNLLSDKTKGNNR